MTNERILQKHVADIPWQVQGRGHLNGAEDDPRVHTYLFLELPPASFLSSSTDFQITLKGCIIAIRYSVYLGEANCHWSALTKIACCHRRVRAVLRLRFLPSFLPSWVSCMLNSLHMCSVVARVSPEHPILLPSLLKPEASYPHSFNTFSIEPEIRLLTPSI